MTFSTPFRCGSHALHARLQGSGEGRHLPVEVRAYQEEGLRRRLTRRLAQPWSPLDPHTPEDALEVLRVRLQRTARLRLAGLNVLGWISRRYEVFRGKVHQ
jgi:hypothetical protein